MRRLQCTLFSQRHLVWLLWLVLLLPIAQTAATWHVLSHVTSDRVDQSDGPQAIHHGHCDLCLSAAALIGGAPLVAAPPLPLAKVPHAPAFADVRGIVWPAPSRAYDSRAPPFSLH